MVHYLFHNLCLVVADPDDLSSTMMYISHVCSLLIETPSRGPASRGSCGLCNLAAQVHWIGVHNAVWHLLCLLLHAVPHLGLRVEI